MQEKEIQENEISKESRDELKAGKDDILDEDLEKKLNNLRKEQSENESSEDGETLRTVYALVVERPHINSTIEEEIRADILKPNHQPTKSSRQNCQMKR